MVTRFDDSLTVLGDVINATLGKSELAKGTALRDSLGRLAFLTSTAIDDVTVETVSATLRKRLGAYARSDRVLAVGEDFGVKEVLKDPAGMLVKAGEHCIRLVDRRLVGADWLRTPAPSAGPPTRFVFASLKGGVGRSTALSVAASDLASSGLRVLAIDLDMEAPGLGAMLLQESTLPEFGVIDALVENRLSGLDSGFLADLVGPSALAQHRGKIDVIPAFGRRSLRNPQNILGKISRVYVEDIRSNGQMATIMDQVRELVDRFSNPNQYDAILIDARAGLHETTASAVLGLGAEVFFFGLNEPQTFQGYSALFSHLASFVGRKDIEPEWLSRLTMVQGKAIGPDAHAIFSGRCKDLFIEAGLVGITENVTLSVPIPEGPFNNVPWNDDVPDEDVLPQDSPSPREAVSIFDDARFRGFDPLQRPDLLTKSSYSGSFGDFLSRIREALPQIRPEPN